MGERHSRVVQAIDKLLCQLEDELAAYRKSHDIPTSNDISAYDVPNEQTGRKGYGNTVAVGHDDLLRRFFFEVYTKIRSEDLKEPPRGGTHGGGVTNLNKPASLSLEEAIDRGPDLQPTRKRDPPWISSTGSDHPRGGKDSQEDEHEFAIPNNDEYGVQGDLVTVGKKIEETKAVPRSSDII